MYVYYLGVVLYTCITFFLAYLFKMTMAIDDIVAKVLLGVMATFMFLWELYYLNRFVYLTVSLESNEMYYGNLFFSKSVKLNEVTITGQVLWYRRMVRFQVLNERYVAIVPRFEDVSYLKAVTKNQQ